MRPPKLPSLPVDKSMLTPGLRLAVAVSGGADSVALLRALHQLRPELGLVLSVAHLHHGLRGSEADGDLEFVRQLATELGLPLHELRANVAAEATEHRESIEEAARRVRYAWFQQLMELGEADAVATGHTLDDQAETVCAKFLRGAWTEGLGGIHPVLKLAVGRVIRPLLDTSRAEVETFLTGLGQTWREDSSNRDAAFTRNRIRHDLLPMLEGWNPRLREHLAQMAVLAQDEEAWWLGELKRLAPQVLMEGKPVRGGGRASAGGLALDVVRFAAMLPALQRRILRHAAGQLQVALDFSSTETLRKLALEGRAGQKCELAQGLRAERTPRELRLTAHGISDSDHGTGPIPEYIGAIPCEIRADFFGIHIKIELQQQARPGNGEVDEGKCARLRNWRPGDRVRLRYSGSARKVKEVLERLRITGSSRAVWPVLELEGQVIWMKGVELEPRKGIAIIATPLFEA